MQIFRAVDRALNRLYVACGYLAAVFLVALAVLVVASIGARILGHYVPGLVEYSGYSMAASSFLALAYTFGENGHIRVALLLNRLRGVPRLITETWCLLAATIFSGYLAVYAVKLTWISWKFEERSEGADAIFIWIPQSAMAFGACLFALCLAHALVHNVLSTRGRGANGGIPATRDHPATQKSATEQS